MDRALPSGVLEGAGERDTAWVATVFSVLEEVAQVDSTWGCLTRPAGRRGSDEALVTRLTNTATARAGRLGIDRGDGWSLRISRGPCPSDSTAVFGP